MTRAKFSAPSSASRQTGVIAKWLVVDGGQVTEGKPLFALEIDEST